jgi:hypothetical protein
MLRAALISLLMTACAGGNDRGPRALWVDELLRPAFNELFAECPNHLDGFRCELARSRLVSLVAVDGEIRSADGDRRAVGLCVGGSIVVMTGIAGYSFTAQYIRETVWHEIGHCAFSLSHDNNGTVMLANKPEPARGYEEWHARKAEFWEAVQRAHSADSPL